MIQYGPGSSLFVLGASTAGVLPVLSSGAGMLAVMIIFLRMLSKPSWVFEREGEDVLSAFCYSQEGFAIGADAGEAGS